MQTWKRNAVLTAVAGVVLAPLGVQAQKVSTDYDHKAEFSGYKTFSFIKVQASDPLVQQRIQDGITSELTKHGLELMPSGGDLEIAAVGSTHSVDEYSTFYNNLGGGGWGWGGWGRRGWGGWGGGPGVGQSTTTVEKVPVGTLRVDLYGEGTHQLVWRGIARDQLSDKPEKNTKKLNKALDKMFDKFPPKTNA